MPQFTRSKLHNIIVLRSVRQPLDLHTHSLVPIYLMFFLQNFTILTIIKHLNQFYPIDLCNKLLTLRVLFLNMVFLYIDLMLLRIVLSSFSLCIHIISSQQYLCACLY